MQRPQKPLQRSLGEGFHGLAELIQLLALAKSCPKGCSSPGPLVMGNCPGIGVSPGWQSWPVCSGVSSPRGTVEAQRGGKEQWAGDGDSLEWQPSLRDPRGGVFNMARASCSWLSPAPQHSWVHVLPGALSRGSLQGNESRGQQGRCEVRLAGLPSGLLPGFALGSCWKQSWNTDVWARSASCGAAVQGQTLIKSHSSVAALSCPGKALV